jgi:hypothetical protein
VSAGRPAPAASQQAGPYKCWALAPEGYWIDPVTIESVEGVWRWLVNPLRAFFGELRVTGMDEEETFISVVGDRLVFPTYVEAGVPEEDYRLWWEWWSAPRREARARIQNAQ